MTFNSYLFLFAFMPITAVIYWSLRKKGHVGAAIWFLIISSLVFYGTVSPTGLIIFVLNLLLNRVFAVHILKNRENKGISSKVLLAAGITVDLLILILFKYFGTTLVISGFKIEAPGISFYTFCEIMLLTECYRQGRQDAENGRPNRSTLRDYLLYLTFFPKLLQGPIVKPEEMADQKEGEAALSFETIYRCLMLFSFGLFKKVILADTLGAAVDFGFADLDALHTGEALIVMLSYTLQLYFDFSGYCDMASAVARIFGFTLPLNFNSPYRAKNIIDFWKRWHITLTGFFTKYVYIPLGGSRKGHARTILNILIIFFLSGLWHGSGWNFLIWGMMHGAAYAILRAIQFRRPFEETGAGGLSEGNGAVLPARGMSLRSCSRLSRAMGSDRTTIDGSRSAAIVSLGSNQRRFRDMIAQAAGANLGTAISTLLTFLYINAAWVFFRAPTVKDALHLFSDMAQLWFPRFNYNLAKCFQIPELWYALKILRIDRLSFGQYVPMALMLLFTLILVFRKTTADEYAKTCRISLWNTLFMTLLLIWGVLSLTGVQTYLYVNF